MNHSNQVAPLLAMLRSWEDRFGARLVRLGFDTLDVSVAAPPTTEEHALHVAAEHWVFCPDNVDQGPGSLQEYAASIRGRNTWSFGGTEPSVTARSAAPSGSSCYSGWSHGSVTDVRR
jgi:hypothetical protein